jgi:hypothetical protein
MEVLKRRIAQLLRDKEETAMIASIATNWLSSEAASFQAINRAGTFRYCLCCQMMDHFYNLHSDQPILFLYLAVLFYIFVCF